MAAMLALAPATIRPGVSLPLFFGFLAGVLALLVWATITQRDRWPFSHYPMFGVATDADSVRFFILRVHFDDGTAGFLGGVADALIDPFHREFERLWRAGVISPIKSEEVALRYWREACRLDGRLIGARRIEVVMRIGRLIRADGVVVGEKSIQVVNVAHGEIDR
ncbi:MAG TPA: hypothetical protein VHE61_21420 [Opitutaceae bacterium]|nr:hypothetical protein [Opitutaceae bacterium]